MKLCKIQTVDKMIRVLYQNYAEQIEKKTLPYFHAEDVASVLCMNSDKLIESSEDVLDLDIGTFISTYDFAMSIPEGNLPHCEILYILGLTTGIIQGITLCIATHDNSIKF